MGSLGPFHWLIVAVVVFLLFGNRLPSVMRSLGQGLVEFKKGLQGIEDDVKGSVDKSKIEETPSKSLLVMGEAKPSEVESGLR